MEELLRRRVYVDQRAGEVTLEAYAVETWMPSLDVDAGTFTAYERYLRLHILPKLGRKAISQITASDVKRLRAGLDGSGQSKEAIMATMATLMQAAMDDNLRNDNPCHARSVTRPKQLPPRAIKAWTPERVQAVIRALPNRFQRLGKMTAGCGHRPNEVIAVSPVDMDRERQELIVQRQLKWVRGHGWCFALPKGRKVRRTPMPMSVENELDAQMREYPTVKVTLPYYDRRDKPAERFRPMTVELIFSREAKGEIKFINPKRFNEWEWKRALVDAGVIPAPAREKRGEYQAARDDGPVALRHFFATAQIDAGESVVDVAAWMGHANPLVTFRRYVRGRVGAGDRGRAATDILLAGVITAAKAVWNRKAV
ncbi:tyrosine-type recombinase/integrase [Streptomyces sp. NPDC020379]|uniref:tyrosine-type recombinase/integrase n=1 Tax=Streptomyces sp. NPDC020379 TaxID=3365071 RepID=UPI0037A33E10